MLKFTQSTRALSTVTALPLRAPFPLSTPLPLHHSAVPAWRYNTQKCGSRFGTGEGQGLGELGEVLGIASSWGAVNRASEKGTGGRRASVPPQVAEARISMLVETDGKAILVRPVVRVCC